MTRFEPLHSLLLTLLFSGLLISQLPAQDEPAPAGDQPFDAKAYFTDVFQSTKTAQSEQDFTTILQRCEVGRKNELSKAYRDYSGQVMAWTYNRRGELRDSQGRSEDAFADFNAAVDVSPASDKLRYMYLHNRGVSYAQQGDLEKALADFTSVIRLKDDFAKAHFNLGELRYLMGDYQQAISAYTRAIELDGDDARAYNARGHAHYKLGNYEAAIADYNRAIRADERFAPAYVNRADAHGDRGNFAAAARDYQTALRHDPDSAYAYRGAAWLMATCPDENFRNGRRAVQAAEKALEIAGNEDPIFLDTAAAAYAAVGDFEKAVATEQKAIELATDESRQQDYEARLKRYQENRPYRDVR